ncbi:MAG: tRNA-dihydrouridine synthase family protein [Planctomycetes bacterium]|nr:tRNA-dihydrouridine synthase family protein [Planctomycetota bacterium]
MESGLSGVNLSPECRGSAATGSARPRCLGGRLHIGSVVLESPVVQAALSGYSDRAMRTVARRLGAAYTVCEVMLDRFVVELRRPKRMRRHLDVGDDEHPVGGQLMGAEPADFGPAAMKLVESGFDVIDINFGCPVKKVLGRCRGGFHLSQPEVALEIVSRVREAVPERIPVTLKMRRGLDDSDGSRERFFTIFDGAFERGVAAVTVHGRTVVQRYDGPSNWSALAEIKRHAGERTVIGSGDLFSPHDCLRMLEETGVDGVSIARGAIGNPWIFPRTRALLSAGVLPDPPTVFEQRDALREHFRLAEEVHGQTPAGRVMRKFGIRYAELHPESASVQRAFIAVTSPADWQRVLDEWYACDGPGREPPPHG